MLPSIAVANETLEFRGSLTWLNAAQANVVRNDHPLNPENRIARVPQTAVASEVKPQFKITSPRAITLLARPRIQMRTDQVKAEDDKTPFKGSARSDLNEAFVQWVLSENVTFAYGKQNYSWGATESLTPSNRLFHETVLARSFLYELSGKNLARLNLSAGNNLSLVLITEYEETDEGDASFVAGDRFETKAMAKAEFNWNGGSDFFGLVGGGRAGGRPWLGEYFSWTLPVGEGFSIYADASHERGANVWYPSRSAVMSPELGSQELRVFDKTKISDERIYTLAVAGLRYDFEQGAIVRLEYIKNDFGYSKEQTQSLYETFSARELQRLSGLSPDLINTNYARIAARGTELPGQRYAYLSMSWPQAFDQTELTLFARTLYSLTDQSSSSYTAVEYNVGEAGTAFYAATVNAGDDTTELSGLSSTTHVAGYRHSW